jgi:AcrR family transcriptional regulator
MAIDTPARNRRNERHEATRSEILEASWGLARENGLSGLALRDIAAKVGMRAPSLYWYFESKHAIYDAMFAEGNRTLLDRMSCEELPTEPRALLRQLASVFVEFGVQDAARFQLMFQRTIPDFEPSPESYALATEVVERSRDWFGASGITLPAHFDLWTALVSGLASQQLANDPGGDRWHRLIDDAVEMFANHVLNSSSTRSST